MIQFLPITPKAAKRMYQRIPRSVTPWQTLLIAVWFLSFGTAAAAFCAWLLVKGSL